MNRPTSAHAARYTITREIASGGMATVYLGRLAGPGGFSRPVAIKRPHPHVARHPEFRAMLLDEGRLAASLSHPNVVSTLDVVAEGDDLFLVMEYVPGRTLAEILRAARGQPETPPPAIVGAVLHGVLLGLSAVHEARDERGAPLHIVHRDISPQNILVGQDGVARILDFGVAKAAGRLQVTQEGQLKGKISYMAPEQMQGKATPRTDIYAASIVLWEALTCARLFSGNDEVETFSKALTSVVTPPSRLARCAPADALDASAWRELDAIVLRGLARDAGERFGSAREMAGALERCLRLATPARVIGWLDQAEEAAGQAAREPASPAAAVPQSGVGAREATATASLQDGAAPHAGIRERSELSGVDVVVDDLALPSATSAGLTATNVEGMPAALARRRRQTLVAALAGVVAAALLMLVLAFRHAPPPVLSPGAPGVEVTATAPPAPSPATVSSTYAAPPAPLSTADAGASARTGAESPLDGAKAQHGPPPKNRVERPRRAPVDSSAIDRALDVRH
jgi:serine/threonine-protein kinase